MNGVLDNKLPLRAGSNDSRRIVGVDETGRGSLIGPVITCAVLFPEAGLPNELTAALGDSKKLTKNRRELVANMLHEKIHYAFGAVSAREVERLNPLQATMLAMSRSVSRLSAMQPLNPKVHRVIVDGNREPSTYPLEVKALIKGDSLVPEIMAASILAKVMRDYLVGRLAKRHDGYGWQKNSGYGSRAHFDALDALGATSHHRSTFIRKHMANRSRGKT